MNEYILENIQNTIILKTNKENQIIKSYTKLLFVEPNTYLCDIFSLKQIEMLIALKKDQKTIIYNNNRLYEAYKEEDTNYRYLYFHDITSFNNIEKKLKKSLNDFISKQEKLQAIFDTAANGISILDTNGMFLYANKFFQKMMGYTMDELKKESCISLSAPEYERPSQTAVEKAIQYGCVERFRKVCVTKAGLHLNASMSLSYIKSTHEIVMITSDITQDIQYQEELKKQVQIELAKRDEQYKVMCHQSRLAAMGKMINSIAHQWRQPLNALGLIVQGLKHINNQQTINKEMLSEIEMEIMEKISFMSQTIDDFNSFFKKSNQKEHFDVLKNITEAIRLIEAQINTYNIKIRIDDKKLIDRNIFGFSNEFRQVLLNLIHNGMDSIIEAQKEQGIIDISLENKNNDLIIQVHDNGTGVDAEYIEKIFDPYFTTKRKGSGIGLYMSKLIIEHHMDGQFLLKDSDIGACFCIILRQKRM